jgi:serine/threonine protein kinase
MPDAAPRLAQFGPGAVIKDRFELERLLGSGGMGMVFCAVDRRKVEAQDPNPRVALKILNPSFAQHPDAFIALQRESSKAQSLAHPNIVTVFDFDRDGEAVFFTMELLRGQSLEDLIDARWGVGTSRAAALPIIRGLTDGLAHAHRKGIVHSDLKPANVFVLEDGTPKILDFGIARAVPSAATSGQSDQFDAGRLGGYTELYATAEMIEGGAEPAPADDLYALGIISYELLTGKHPFGGKNLLDARQAGLKPASIRALQRREWRALCAALAFERGARPRDAAEFSRLFFQNARLRNSLLAAVAMLVLAAAYLWYRNFEQSGPAIAFEQLPPAEQHRIQADLADGNRELAFYQQQGIAEALNDALDHFADAYSRQKGNRDAVKGLETVARDMLEHVGDDPEVRRELARNLAQHSEFLKTYPPVMDAMAR